MSESNTKPKFCLGQIVATPGCLEALASAGQTALEFVHRHVRGDWGEELCEEDRRLNDEALSEGGRILSAYRTKANEKIWIITEATDDRGQRAATTLILPQEY
jgi:hypothetical protein